jgi:D-arabinose 1-dehydrogenase-like Zn-dependent alcohol dehydrogenase
MRAPVLQGRRSMTYEEVSAPEAGDGEVLLEIGLCGVCGSDLHGRLHRPGRQRLGVRRPSRGDDARTLHELLVLPAR